MSPINLLRLFSLAAIWGSSFIFMRIGAPPLGPLWVAESRVALAAIFLTLVGLVLGRQLASLTHWRHYLVLSFFNSALPFVLFAYAAQTISVSLMAVLNATAPIWGAIIGVVWAGSRLDLKTGLGLALGLVGVAVLVGFDASAVGPDAALAIAAALVAALCYGIATQYTKSAVAPKSVKPFANAQGAMIAASLIIAPTVGFAPVPLTLDTGVIAALLMLGIVCSGVAYLLYFRLIEELGAVSALTVTFLIPVFGVAWGSIFLNEAFGWHTILGASLVIAGTMLVTGFTLASLSRAAE